MAVDEGQEHTMSVWDWQRGERGSKITETKCATETVVAAEFHPLEAGVIVTIGKGHVNFWTLDNTRFDLSFENMTLIDLFWVCSKCIIYIFLFTIF